MEKELINFTEKGLDIHIYAEDNIIPKIEQIVERKFLENVLRIEFEDETGFNHYSPNKTEEKLSRLDLVLCRISRGYSILLETTPPGIPEEPYKKGWYNTEFFNIGNNTNVVFFIKNGYLLLGYANVKEGVAVTSKKPE